MKCVNLLGLLALAPAALNPAPASASGAGLVVALCRDGKASGTITLPLGSQFPPARDGEGCCVKGCHAGSNRKRLFARF